MKFRNDRIKDIVEHVSEKWEGARVYENSSIFPHLDLVICHGIYRYEILKGENVLVKKNNDTREELCRMEKRTITQLMNFIRGL